MTHLIRGYPATTGGLTMIGTAGAPATLERTMTDYDMDHDGYAETEAFDTDHDGHNDTVLVDVDHDGRYDAVGYDSNEDGRFDQTFIDMNHDDIDDRANVFTAAPTTWMPNMGGPGDSDYSTLGDVNDSPEAANLLQLGVQNIAEQQATTEAPNPYVD